MNFHYLSTTFSILHMVFDLLNRSSYLKENTTCLHYKDYVVNVVKEIIDVCFENHVGPQSLFYGSMHLSKRVMD